VIVEGTAGNTGIGLALVGPGPRLRVTVIVMPDNAEPREEGACLRALGAQLHPGARAVPYKPTRATT
jgi:cysteine synthase